MTFCSAKCIHEYRFKKEHPEKTINSALGEQIIRNENKDEVEESATEYMKRKEAEKKSKKKTVQKQESRAEQKEIIKIDENTIRKLQDSHWQEGLNWRKKMIVIIARLKRDGISYGIIFKELKKCGLTTSTANTLMDDAEFFDDNEKSVFDMSPEEYAVKVDKLRGDKK